MLTPRDAASRALRQSDQLTYTIVRLWAVENELVAADDGGEKIIEVVSNPACELTHRFHLRCLAQGLLSPHPSFDLGAQACVYLRELSVASIELQLQPKCIPEHDRDLAVHHSYPMVKCTKGHSAGQTVEAERVKRRLAAILAADVAGYSRLIGADKEALAQRELIDTRMRTGALLQAA